MLLGVGLRTDDPAMEIWTTGTALPKVGVRLAERAEADGFDGYLVTDSQNLAGDPYVTLALAAKATERLKLGTGVTNPYTRHPAVTASSIAHVQAESGGRAVLGIGRGDSSLAHLGLGPAPVPAFERYLARLQGYLRGEEVELDSPEAGGVPAASTPTSSRLHWLRPSQPKVPVDVAASGPKVIAAAARHAERITFAVGAAPQRLRWAMGVASAEAAGPVSFGAYVNVVCHPDSAAALALASGAVTSFARFSVMHGTPTGPVTDEQRQVMERIPQLYDMTHHFQSQGAQTEAMTAAFADSYAVLGPADHCISLLLELEALGLERVVVIGPAFDADRADAASAHARFVADVLPAVSARRGG